MSAARSISTAAAEIAERPDSLEEAIRRIGEQMLALMEQAETPALFSKKGFYGALMGWAMQDAQFKTQLFPDMVKTPTNS